MNLKKDRTPTPRMTCLNMYQSVVMRLSQHELAVIRNTLRAVDPMGKIVLFGSRTLDIRKGGDIDIYFETSERLDLATRLALEYKMSALCDTQEALLIKTSDLPERAIFANASEGIPL